MCTLLYIALHKPLHQLMVALWLICEPKWTWIPQCSWLQ
jgi:hypothetical protein